MISNSMKIAEYNMSTICIPGVKWKRNRIQTASEQVKILSNEGSAVHHFVQHTADFSYNTFGIHRFQDDELTFLAVVPKEVTAILVDCRMSSPEFGKRHILTFTTSPHQRLVIPRGVAHTFEGLDGVTTRNDYILYRNCSTSAVDHFLDNIQKNKNHVFGPEDAVDISSEKPMTRNEACAKISIMR